VSDLRVVREFKSDLMAAAGGGKRRRRWLLVPIVATALATTGALAATDVIEVGAPAKQGPREHGGPPEARAPVVAGSVEVSGFRAPDPAGGPPWTVRTFRNRAGQTCIQAGRVAQGEFGIFGTDGRLHPLPVRRGQGPCLRLPSPRRDRPLGGISAAGPAVSDEVGGAPPCDYVVVRRSVSVCDDTRMRALSWGLAGPNARYLVSQFPRSSRARRVTLAPGGAYVIVRRASEREGGRFWFVYKGGARSRPAFVGPSEPERDVRTQRGVRVRLSPAAGRPDTAFRLSWRVPLAGRGWTYRLIGPGGERCQLRMSTSVFESRLRAGRRVVRRLTPPGPEPKRWCAGTYRGDVRSADHVRVGRFAFTVR
jgi:hypothetical protein